MSSDDDSEANELSEIIVQLNRMAIKKTSIQPKVFIAVFIAIAAMFACCRRRSEEGSLSVFMTMLKRLCHFIFCG